MKSMTALTMLAVMAGLIALPACGAEKSAPQSATVKISTAKSSMSKHTVTLNSLLSEMINRDTLARWPEPAYTAKECTSYDRASVSPDQPGWFANHDTANFLRTEVNEGRTEYVMMDTDGPGAIVSFFKASTDPTANVRVYLDNGPTPVINENERYLLGGGIETEQEKNYFQPRVPPYPPDEAHFLGGYGTIKPPLAGVQSLGCTLYLPIPYATHCKVTYDKPGNCFYRINYRTYTPGTRVVSFTLPALKAAGPQIDRASRILLNPDTITAGISTRPAQTQTLKPGDTQTVTLGPGPAALRFLSVKLNAASLTQALRSTVLQITFDGAQTVWCPVGDFFSSGIGVHASRGWDKAVEADGTLHCSWTMPFQKTCRIQLLNLGTQPVDSTLITGGTAWIWDARSLYFHAGWRQQYPIQTKANDGTMDWNYLEASGKGVYVGDTLVMHNGDTDWWGEGDEKIYVDGEDFPSQFGTGTEDYYGYSRGGSASEFFEAPFLDHPQVEGDKQIGYSAMTRVRSLDAIPFTNHLKFDMEIWHHQATTVAYAATTYWYALDGATSNRFPTPDEAARPLLQDSQLPSP